MTCCSEELSAAKSSLSRAPLPLNEVPWNIGISGAHPMAFVWEKFFWHHTSVVSSSCPISLWELRRKDFVTSRWQLGWYLWVFWSIKLSLVNTISGFLRETNALEKKKMSFIDPVPKAMFSYNYGVHCFGSLSSRTKAFSYSISRFSEYRVTEANSPCLCFVPKMSPLTVLTILKIPAAQCSLVHFERSAQAIQKIIGSINFNTGKIRKPYLTLLFLKHLYKLKREDKLCQKQINSLLLLTTPSKILFFSSSWLETPLI